MGGRGRMSEGKIEEGAGCNDETVRVSKGRGREWEGGKEWVGRRKIHRRRKTIRNNDKEKKRKMRVN